MRLSSVSLDDVMKVREWRNDDIDSLRTPFLITDHMQEDFYYNVVCNRTSPHRYWSIYDCSVFMAFMGLVNISWENRHAEISLIVNPDHRKEGVGRAAINMLLDEGFNRLNLHMIYGECYMCNKDFQFWETCEPDHKALLKYRKYCNGRYYDSLYFSFERR